MFEFLKTGIDGLDAILGGGIRYPAESSAFVFATGGAGSGKTILALEMLTRAWLHGEDGTYAANEGIRLEAIREVFGS